MTTGTDATVELRSLTLGTGTQYGIDPAGISGLGSPEVKTADTPFGGQDGSFGAPDFLDVRLITITVVLLGEDPTDAFDLLDALNDAWAPCRDGVDIDLTISLPGRTIIATGRPRGVDVDTSTMRGATLKALLRFDCLEPNLDITPDGP